MTMAGRLSLVASILAHIAAAAGVAAFSPAPHHDCRFRGQIASRQPLQPPSSGRPVVRTNRSDSRRGRLFEIAQTPSSSDAIADPSIASDANDVGLTYYHYLLSQFRGDFDNYEQVVQDRKRGLAPGEGGGHENIHCTLVPCPVLADSEDGTKSHQHTDGAHWVLAAFYFNGDPTRIFRFRLYQLLPPTSEGMPVRMKLNTLLPHLEGQLRQCSDRPWTWWKEVWGVWCKDSNNNNSEDGPIDAARWNELRDTGLASMSSSLEGCDVLWEPDWDPSKHSYLYADEYADCSNSDDSISDSPDAAEQVAALPLGQSYHATMEAGSKGAIVDSISMIPGKRILIKDELSLWEDEFWINDRGYDPDEVVEKRTDNGSDGEGSGESGTIMPFVYGNQRGVPYKLKRVSHFHGSGPGTESCLELERTVSNPDLEWTLGEENRTPDLFQEKMQGIFLEEANS